MKIVNEEELFKISDIDNLEINSIEVGHTKTPVIYVDNFYKNPNTVREFSESVYYSYSKHVRAGFPGARCSLNLDVNMISDFIYSTFNKILSIIS